MKPIKRAPTGTLRRRSLHPGHFAFMRSLVLGVDLNEAWDRYLRLEGGAGDLRVVRSTVQWIRDEFAAAAQRLHRPGTARLVLLDVSQIPQPWADQPTLEAFAQERGLEGFSQAEQIEAYKQAFGSQGATNERDRRLAARRKRLQDKQLEALAWLEGLVAQQPQLGDGVGAWLHPSIADHLHGADIVTLAQLIDRINGLGQRWWVSVPAIGPVKAGRVEEWLRDQEDVLGAKLGAHVAMPRSKVFAHELAQVVQPATAIRPIEKFVVPSALDGRAGLYRLPQSQCLLKASNDLEAIFAWLRSKQALTPEQKASVRSRRKQRSLGVEQGTDWLQTLSHTQRAYRKEAERFLLWAILQKGKALSSMTHEDCVECRDFLADPQPRSRWCGTRSRERWSPLWRPFEGPLSPTAQRYTLTVLRNLYGFLNSQNYLAGNPWASVSVPRVSTPSMNAGRSFTLSQWEFIQGQMDRLPPSSANDRLRFVLRLAYDTGLRLSELVAAKVDDLRWVVYPPEPGESATEAEVAGWVLSVVGKGGRLREVPVSEAVSVELSAYLAKRGLDSELDGQANRGAFLLGRSCDIEERMPGLSALQGADHPTQGISARTIYGQVKAFFESCSEAMRGLGDSKASERFAAASTHWLRHSHASHSIAKGVPIEMAQANLGHASLSTTTVYVTTESRRRMKAMGKFWG